MKNNLLENLSLRNLNETYSPPFISRYVDISDSRIDNQTFDIGKTYTLSADLGVKIQSQKIGADQIKQAERYIARKVYGQYVDELLDWYYRTDVMRLLDPDEQAKFSEILESMQGG